MPVVQPVLEQRERNREKEIHRHQNILSQTHCNESPGSPGRERARERETHTYTQSDKKTDKKEKQKYRQGDSQAPKQVVGELMLNVLRCQLTY